MMQTKTSFVMKLTIVWVHMMHSVYAMEIVKQMQMETASATTTMTASARWTHVASAMARVPFMIVDVQAFLMETAIVTGTKSTFSVIVEAVAQPMLMRMESVMTLMTVSAPSMR